MSAKTETILITGSAGFIGSYIVQAALDRGFNVIGIDNFSKYGYEAANHIQDPNYLLIEGDVKDPSLLLKYMAQSDHVIAGAAMIGGISYFHKYAYDLLAENERIIAATCDAAIQIFPKGRLKKVTYLSSSMVYESSNVWPSKESDLSIVPPPISSYGFQKLAVEYFARAAFEQYGLPFTILRPFNCVGIGEKRALSDDPMQSDAGSISLTMSHVVPDLIMKILSGQDPLEILGDGSQIRCYTYGKDLANGIITSLNHRGSLNEDFNISTSVSHSVLEVAELIWRRINPEQPFSYMSMPAFKHDVQKRIPNVEKARILLGVSCDTPLEVVLDELIPWIKMAIDKNWI